MQQDTTIRRALPAFAILLAVGTASAQLAEPQPPSTIGSAAAPNIDGDDLRGIGGLPEVFFPPENPLTEPKRVLGKILFWDEQLSSDNTRACASCHIPSAGGTEPFPVPNPGVDGEYGTEDDRFTSRGIIRSLKQGSYTPDPVFRLDPQTTSRTANPTVFAAYFGELFWDGRAGGEFIDPETGETVIPIGGSLESQAVGPIVSDVEMAHEDRDWTEVAAKLEKAVPLALARDLTPDTAAALDGNPTYPELFERAFGDSEISAARIGMALATYQRTLIPDQSPWDLFIAGDESAMTPEQQLGWTLFQGNACVVCHSPPFFTDFNYHNVGVRPNGEDPGRAGVTHLEQDQSAFKTPTLRNNGLKRNFFHNGQAVTFRDMLDVYAADTDFEANPNRSLFLPIILPEIEIPPIRDFIMNGLTDPRVASEEFPFDRPTLYHEWNGAEWSEGNPAVLPGGTPGTDGATPRAIAVTPPNVGNADFKIGLTHPLPGATATLAISASEPIGGVVAHDQLAGPYTLTDDGLGLGYTTHLMPIPSRPVLDGDTLYLQWRVDDPAAAGGVALSQPVRLELFCNGPCPASPCPADIAQPFDVLDLADVQAFIGAFSIADPLADIAEPFGVLDLADVQTFITKLQRWLSLKAVARVRRSRHRCEKAPGAHPGLLFLCTTPSLRLCVSASLRLCVSASLRLCVTLPLDQLPAHHPRDPQRHDADRAVDQHARPRPRRAGQQEPPGDQDARRRGDREHTLRQPPGPDPAAGGHRVRAVIAQLAPDPGAGPPAPRARFDDHRRCPTLYHA
jgi:cytochrome c peroxidase